MSRSAEHRLQISAQANAHAVRVMPEPKLSDERSNGMQRLAEHRLQISAQANAHAVRVMPKPKPSDEGSNSMTPSSVVALPAAGAHAARRCRA
jgi:hypothetical protein